MTDCTPRSQVLHWPSEGPDDDEEGTVALLDVVDDEEAAAAVRDLLAPVVPNDAEVVAALRRLAAARAQLLAAERCAHDAGPSSSAPRAVPELDRRRAEVLWAQAELIVTPGARRQRALDGAEAALAEALARHGFDDFAEYLRARQPRVVDDVDPHLQLARREHDDAQRAWRRLEAEFGERTVVIDLTGDEPRRLA